VLAASSFFQLFRPALEGTFCGIFADFRGRGSFVKHPLLIPKPGYRAKENALQAVYVPVKAASEYYLVSTDAVDRIFGLVHESIEHDHEGLLPSQHSAKVV
jgi:hypothetical protein